MRYGQDSSVVLVREKAWHLQKKDLKGTLIDLNYPEGIRIKDKHGKESLRNVTNPSIIPVKVYLGPKHYKGFKVEHDLSKICLEGKWLFGKEISYAWSLKNLNTLISKYHDYEVDTEPQKLSWIDNENKTVDENFFREYDNPQEVIDFMIKNKISIITVMGQHICSYDTDHIRANGDNLKNIQFQKRIDPFQTYQILSQWVGGVLPNSGNEMTTISDKMKVHKHGFDEWSFRKKSEEK